MKGRESYIARTTQLVLDTDATEPQQNLFYQGKNSFLFYLQKLTFFC
jgi:hypothetical protein